MHATEKVFIFNFDKLAYVINLGKKLNVILNMTFFKKKKRITNGTAQYTPDLHI